MKKLVVILGVLLLATAVLAQDEGKGLSAKGFKVGLNLANVSGSDVDALLEAVTDETGLNADKKMLMGFAFGGFLTFNLSPTIALQPEVLYSMKGFKVTVEGVDVDMTLNYLEIPVLLKARFGNSTTRPSLFAGPALGILLSSKAEASGFSVDTDDLWKTTDFGIVFGGGVDFPAGQGTMMFDARYTLGLTQTPDSGPVDIDIKNTNISFMLGYGF